LLRHWENEPITDLPSINEKQVAIEPVVNELAMREQVASDQRKKIGVGGHDSDGRDLNPSRAGWKGRYPRDCDPNVMEVNPSGDIGAAGSANRDLASRGRTDRGESIRMDPRSIGPCVDQRADCLRRSNRLASSDQAVCDSAAHPDAKVDHRPIRSDRDADDRHQRRMFGI
jgi:hypothetical protein